MFIVILIILFLTLLLTPVSSYVPVEERKGIKWKFYIDFDKEICYQRLDQISNKYKEGITYIMILPDSRVYNGMYWYGVNHIDLYGDCYMDTIVHELSHHCQYQRGDYYYEVLNHLGHFDECEDEIWDTIE